MAVTSIRVVGGVFVLKALSLDGRWYELSSHPSSDEAERARLVYFLSHLWYDGRSPQEKR